MSQRGFLLKREAAKGMVAERVFTCRSYSDKCNDAGAGKVYQSVEELGDGKKLRSAIATLQELVGRTITVNRETGLVDFWPPFRVVRIDYEAEQEDRCVVDRAYPNGSHYYMRRSVTQVTSERKFSEADAAICTAKAEDLLRALALLK